MQEHKEVQCFLVAAEEAEGRSARFQSVRRGQSDGSSEEKYQSDSEDDDDADEQLAIKGCGQRTNIDLDDGSSGSEHEGRPHRVLNGHKISNSEDLTGEASRGRSNITQSAICWMYPFSQEMPDAEYSGDAQGLCTP